MTDVHNVVLVHGDVETTRNVLDQLDGPAILVGHSYGGVLITEAGDDDRVAGLVYVTAFVPDAGESVSTLIANPPAGAPVPSVAEAAASHAVYASQPASVVDVIKHAAQTSPQV